MEKSPFQNQSLTVLGRLQAVPSPLELWTHQVEAVLKLRKYFDPNDRSVNPDGLNTALVVLPNGCGKTGVAVLASYALNASRALVITPSTIVSEQVYDAYKHFLLDRKIITDDELDEFLPSIATVA